MKGITGIMVFSMLLFITGCSQNIKERVADYVPKWGPLVLDNNPPDDCPFKQSDDIAGIVFTGKSSTLASCDTWYPFWAPDGNLYSSWTDGIIDTCKWTDGITGKFHGTGIAKISGNDPLNLKISSLGTYPDPPDQYPGAHFIYKGIWYYSTYNIGSAFFRGFRYSSDMGLTWTACPYSTEKGLFNESTKDTTGIRIGVPRVVDFGQDFRHSPDVKVYFTAHGALKPDKLTRMARWWKPDENLNWLNGDQLFLFRIQPSPENINDPKKYEFYCGNDENNNPVWSNNLKNIKPIINWNDRCGLTSVTYHPVLKKYIFCISYSIGYSGASEYDTYILESDKLTGPYKLVTYWKRFGTQAYMVNIPSKFISPDGKTAYLWYSANYTNNFLETHYPSNPPGSRYALCVQEIIIADKQTFEDYRKKASFEIDDPLLSPDNYALQAVMKTSSFSPELWYKIKDAREDAANDGIVNGFPDQTYTEWASDREKEGAWIQLKWAVPRKITKIWLFDRPNLNDQILEARITTSDGFEFKVGELPNDAKQAKEICFPEHTVEWIKLEVLKTSPSTKNIGLSEIAVFK